MSGLIAYFGAAAIAFIFIVIGEFCKRKFPEWRFSKWFNNHVMYTKDINDLTD